MSTSVQMMRNAGPSWGFAFLARAQQLTPRWLLRPALMAGTWVAVARMPEQRRHSRAFLDLVLGRPARLGDVWRHFFSFVELLMLRLHLADGGPVPCALTPETAAGFEGLLATGEPALFGTFHFGHSDLLGFLLGARGRRIAMIRLQMGNSSDTRQLGRLFSDWVSFIWVNDPANVIYAVKAAIEAGDSIAMQCDRSEFTARTEAFEFLGASRLFPVTIYHLAILFDRPVVFCLGLPDGNHGTRVIASPVFRPDASTREENFRRAHQHFQAVLTELEALVRRYPALWFNFHPLNAVAAPILSPSTTPAAVPGQG